MGSHTMLATKGACCTTLASKTFLGPPAPPLDASRSWAACQTALSQVRRAPCPHEGSLASVALPLNIALVQTLERPTLLLPRCFGQNLAKCRSATWLLPKCRFVTATLLGNLTSSPMRTSTNTVPVTNCPLATLGTLRC